MDRIKFNEINADGFLRFASYNDTVCNKPDIFNNDENHIAMNYIKQCPLLAGNKVIDIGCGTGDFSIYLSNFGYNVTGIDSSENMLLVARNKLSVLKKNIERRNEVVKNPGFTKDPNASILLSTVEPKIKFIKDDIHNLKILNDKFNIATALNYIEYVHPEALPALVANVSNLIYNTGIAAVLFKTENYFTYREDKKYADLNFNCDIKYSFDQNTKFANTLVEFHESPAVKEPFAINFAEYSYSIKAIADLFQSNGMNIIRIFPDTQIHSTNDCNINSICDAVESTYSMPNGVKTVFLIAQKLT